MTVAACSGVDLRPTFDTILARLVKMRADAGIPSTPSLQKYKLRAKSQESRHSSEKVMSAVNDVHIMLILPFP
jgi:hypothetical protein